MNLQKDSYKTFAEAEIEKNEIIKIIKEKKEGENNFSQIYYQFQLKEASLLCFEYELWAKGW